MSKNGVSRRKFAGMILTIVMTLIVAGCGKAATIETIQVESIQVESISEGVQEESVQESIAETSSETLPEPVTESSVELHPESSTESTAVSQPESASESSEAIDNEVPKNGRLIVIDAGHQAKGNSDKEPIGPGATETKAKVASGTKGCVSGLYEYELTLMVSEKLAQELEARGYTVQMIRTTHDVNISNAERAQVANEAGADVFIRIHANGSNNGSVSRDSLSDCSQSLQCCIL